MQDSTRLPMRLVLERHPAQLVERLGDVRRVNTADHSDILHVRTSGASEDQLIVLLATLIARIRVSDRERVRVEPVLGGTAIWISGHGELVGIPDEDSDLEIAINQETDKILGTHSDDLRQVAKAFGALKPGEQLRLDFDPQKLAFRAVPLLSHTSGGRTNK